MNSNNFFQTNAITFDNIDKARTLLRELKTTGSPLNLIENLDHKIHEYYNFVQKDTDQATNKW